MESLCDKISLTSPFQFTLEKKILSFREPIYLSSGICQDKEIWIIKLWEKENPKIQGKGECSPLFRFSLEKKEDLERKIASLSKKRSICEKDILCFPSLRFAFQMAVQNLRMGKEIFFPSEFTSGKEGLPLNAILWRKSHSESLAEFREKVALGFSCVKMKVSEEIEDMANLLSEIRSEFPKEQIEIRLDANGCFSEDEVWRNLDILSQFEIHSIEQPIQAGQKKGMREICKNSPIPITLDEELMAYPKEEKRNILEEICPAFLGLKPQFLGGFSECAEWISLAEEREIGYWISTALESNLGLNALSQWAAIQKTPLAHGLSTVEIFKEETESNLEILNGKLYFKEGRCSL